MKGFLHYLRTVLFALIVSIVSCRSEAAPPVWSAKVFAPYAYVPYEDAATPCLAETGQKFYTLAFVLSDSRGFPAWDGSRDLRVSDGYFSSQIQAIRDQGGDVLISFGGESGSELALKTPDAAQLAEKYQSVIDQYRVTWLDFDIEGKTLGNAAANHRRNSAIAILQKKSASLKISFTLPVNPDGLEDDSIALLKDAVVQGVVIESVNLMTMDYGATVSTGKKMGDLALAAAEAAHRQVLVIAPATKIGLTPMIGQNDEKGEIFSLDDARQVLAFAQKTPWVRSLGFWAINRDQPYTGGQKIDLNITTGIEQTKWDFTNIFKPLSDFHFSE